MREMYVQFHRVEDILDFVSMTSRYPYAINLSCGRLGVDGKSLMGVMAIGLDKPVKVQIQSEEAETLERELGRYRVLT